MELKEPITHTTTPIYVGSTVLAMKYNKGVLIACDVRLNYGSLCKFMNVSERCQQINVNTFLASTGEFSDFQEIVRTLKELSLEDSLRERSYLGPKEIVSYLSSVNYYRRNKMDPYLTTTIVGGIDQEGKPVLHSVDQFGTLLESNYLLSGMGHYFCNSIIAPRYPSSYENIDRDEAISILEDCFRVLYYRDTRAGNTIKFTWMESKGPNEVPEFNSFQRTIESKWDFRQFYTESNEKLYLLN